MTEYQKYQLNWMLEHNYSVKCLVERLGKIANEYFVNNGFLSFDKIFDEAFDIFQKEQGFYTGEKWASEEDFNRRRGLK